MSVTIEEFTAKLGWKTDSTGLKQFQKSMSGLTAGVMKWGGLITGLFTGAMARLLVTTNAATTQNYLLAKSFGVSASTLSAWGNALKPLGMGADYVGSSISFMSRQMGKIKLGQGAEQLKKLSQLGLGKDVLKMNTEDQYKTIMEAARTLPDQQIAVASLAGLVDRTGAGAAKMIGYFRQSGMSIDQMLTKYKALSMMDEEGRQGAIKFTKAWNETTIIIESLKKEFFGLMGEALAPMLDSMSKWVVANKTLIKSRLKHWAEEIAKLLKLIFTWGSKIVGTFGKLIDKVGGFNNAIKLAMIAIVAFKVTPILTQLALLNGANLLSGFKTTLGSFAKTGVIGGLIAVAALAMEDLWVSLTGGDSLGNRLSLYVVAGIEQMQMSFLRSLGLTEDIAKKALFNFEYRLTHDKATNMPTVWDKATGKHTGETKDVFALNKMRQKFGLGGRSNVTVPGQKGKSFEGITSDKGKITLQPGFDNSRFGKVRVKAPKNPIVVNNSVNINSYGPASGKDIAAAVDKKLGSLMNKALLNADTGGER